MPFEKYRPFLPLELPRSHLAGPAHRARAALVFRRPARRQPGADRSDGSRAQAPHVRRPGQDRLQGDRGRLPVGQPARLRLRAPAHRRGSHPRRCHDPGAGPVPARADRADLRVPRGGAPRDRPFLQLDLGAAAPGGLRPRPGRDHRHRRDGGASVPHARDHLARHSSDLRVLTGELHGHRARLRRRDLRGGDGCDRAHRRSPADHEPPGDGRDVHAQRLRRRHRVVQPHGA